jgi:flagellar biosynthesis GTPase FlhF
LIVLVTIAIFRAGSLYSESGTALTQENAPHERQLYAATSENSPAPDDQRLKQEAQRYYQQQQQQDQQRKDLQREQSHQDRFHQEVLQQQRHTEQLHQDTLRQQQTPGTKTSGDAAATTVTGNALTVATT